jgi:ATP-dependent RNA helicase DDX59
MPSSVDEYIHQIGRAGRLGSKGLAMTFINNTNKAVFLHLVEAVQAHGVKLPDELLNSPHLSSQQYEREHKRKIRKRKREESYVNRENLMDILKKSTFRRRLKDR